ncbi:MAG: hypothetical protein VB071_14640 [Lawsonibacter sp.]|nr:hypothetical protein [Lawsonibacter sp.]
MDCGQFNCGKMHCGACCGGACHKNDLILTPTELDLLHRLATLAFLPVACREGEDVPYCLEGSVEPAAITGLHQKGLICVDYDIPLLNFDYIGYEGYPVHGSMALTASGQTAVECMDIQGIDP